MSAATPAMINACSTVRVVVGEALRAAADALLEGAPNAPQVAQAQWQSAHAALRVVNHKGLVQFSQELGNLISSTSGAQRLAAKWASAGADALIKYMDELIAGRRDQPLRLLPAYRDMLRARGVEQVSESDLFFPDLDVGPGDRPDAMAMNADGLRNARRRLETGLLMWLRKADDPAGLMQVLDAVSSIEGAQRNSGDRSLWWIARAVLDAVAKGGLSVDNSVRRFVTQLNLHLGRMVQGPAARPEPLMRDALFLAARARAVSPLVEEVQKTCGLVGALDVEEGGSAGFSSDAMTAARRDTEGLQDLWNACVAGQGNVGNFADRVEALNKSSQALALPAFSALVSQLASTAWGVAGTGKPVTEAAALEGACALLMIDHVLAAGTPPDAGFAQRSQNMVARLKVCVSAPETLASLPAAQLQDDEARRVEAKALSSVVHGEVTRGLRLVEEALEGWFRDSAKVESLKPLDKPLAQVSGAFAVMGHADAARLASECRGEVARYAGGASCDVQARQLLARRLTALSTFANDARQGTGNLAEVMQRMGLPVPVALATIPRLVSGAAVDATAAPAVAPASTPAQPPAEVVAPVSVVPAVAEAAPMDGEGADPDMLDIFLEEAGEVLGTLRDTMPASQAEPQNQEHLTTLRRAFHTLKGSGRMVGLKHLGEAAWEMEQVMNEMLPARQPGTPDLYRLIGAAHGAFDGWISELRAQKRAHIDARQIVDWARKVRAGVPLPGAEAAVDLPPESIETRRSVSPHPDAPPIPQDSVKVGDISVSRQLYEIFLPEAQSYAGAITVYSQRVQDGAKVDGEFMRSVHTLSGISGTTGFPMVRNLGASLEHLLQSVLDRDGVPTAEGRALIVRASAALSAQVGKIAQKELPADHPQLVAALDAAAREVPVAVTEAPPQTSIPVVDTPALHTMDFSSGLFPTETPAASSTPATPVTLTLEQAPAVIETTIALPAATATATATATTTTAEFQFTGTTPPATPATPATEPSVPEMPVVETPVPAASPVISDSERSAMERRNYRLNDDVDQQLLPIFLTEAQELVPQVGQDLRDWRARPDDKLIPQSLKRLLHTLKGSARMAGAMALGQLTHSMESRVENASLLPVVPDSLFDDLEGSFDRIGVLIESLQGADEAIGEAEAPGELPDTMGQMAKSMRVDTATLSMPAATDTTTTQAPVFITQSETVFSVQRPLIRVRADLIDRLANQAGEVSIARARVSAELRSARGTLRDLTENISRLRAQLRELEIQAETQMQSRFSASPERADGKFDPLEFDRFTRLQELTRLMAESVNDVATVQQNLTRDLDEGEKALAAQSQMTREVQQDLLAIRMVPFASLSDRLYRVTRLAGKDSGKRVQLDIKGGHVELDRGVLDRMAAPIEHLLRNAIAHGIEAPDWRRAAGKEESGELVIEVRQEGNEVVLTLSDDGGGLDIERIRDKAISLGLMRPDETLTDQQIGNFIFRSGFSTAGQVSAVAGRGVGMDVVMSEISGLGGRVGTAFERGKGTTFTIHLPLTLSVVQGVVVRLNGNLYAMPTMMVEQLQRLKPDALSAARSAKKIEWQGHEYPFHHLRDLLELPAGETEHARFGSVVLVRSGSQRCAIQVDDITGGQEIVIKNVGPQLARVPGVTGAAVLGSGDTVLILNPVQLALRAQEKSRLAVVAPAQPAAAAAQPARQRTVLVVDDSLTVRKITGRLLTREGYHVEVAKDGLEALEKMQDQRPDVMITDVEMPRMDGFDLTRNVRASTTLNTLPIIMITSRTADKHRQHATELGVNVFLGKPYEEGDLLKHIKALAEAAAVA